MTTETRRSVRRPLIVAGVVILILAVLLGLDLANRGLAWQLFWSLTGEETPVGQARGMVAWAGRWLRPQPETQPLAVIAHTGVNPYGINTFLQLEVEPAKREQQLRMIANAGFAWIRQEFPWEDIEIHGRGDFIDRRNDVDGDGVIDAIDAWAKYDQIVALAGQYGLEIQARLSNPPAWAQASPDSGDFAPPADVQDFVNYAIAVAERYRGRVHYYQVWNEPNIYPEWGENAVDPEAYTELLCRTYAALKRVDPEIVVIDGALAPTVELSGRNLNDFIYLQRMYDAGAGACFDIHSMQGYGLNSGPTDQRMRPTDVNFARNLYIRDIMVANGDAHKPIWISEAAWSPVDEPDVPGDIIGFGNYGRVTEEQAARYMPLAYERARREWPWIGVANYWFFKLPSDHDRNQAFYYFRMVEPDFTPLPVYETMRDYIQSEEPTLFLGIHQETDRAITYANGVEMVAEPSAQLRQAAQTTAAEFTAHGTLVRLRWRGIREIQLTIDDSATALHGVEDADGWLNAALYQSLLAETHTFTLSASEPFLLDSVMVLDRAAEQTLPVIAGGGGLLLVALGVALSAVWKRAGRG